jgi:hypothetical protein
LHLKNATAYQSALGGFQDHVETPQQHIKESIHTQTLIHAPFSLLLWTEGPFIRNTSKQDGCEQQSITGFLHQALIRRSSI